MNDIDKRLEDIEGVLMSVPGFYGVKRETVEWLISTLKAEREEKERLVHYPHQYKRLRELCEVYEKALEQIETWEGTKCEMRKIAKAALGGDRE